MYGSVVYSSCSKENLDRILNLFNGLNWIPFTDESFIRRSAIVYKRVNVSYNCPKYIDSLLIR